MWSREVSAFKIQAADRVAQRGNYQLFNTLYVVLNFVSCGLGIGYLEVNNRVNADYQVVLGDYRLRGEKRQLSLLGLRGVGGGRCQAESN